MTAHIYVRNLTKGDPPPFKGEGDAVVTTPAAKAPPPPRRSWPSANIRD
jgi:hypothetical protein